MRQSPKFASFIGIANSGREYVPGAPNVYKSKKDAQDAHEAVRPTSAMRTPDEMAAFLARKTSSSFIA